MTLEREELRDDWTVTMAGGTGAPDGVAGRGEGEVEVRAGVAVGDGVDVEGVDLLARGGERLGGLVEEAHDGRDLAGLSRSALHARQARGC